MNEKLANVLTRKQIELQTKFYKQYRSGTIPQNVNLEEILNLAKKKKNKSLATQGLLETIHKNAELAYVKSLYKIDKNLGRKYKLAKNGDLPEEEKKQILLESSSILNDTVFKSNYINEYLKIDEESDQTFLREAFRSIAKRKVSQEEKKLRKFLQKSELSQTDQDFVLLGYYQLLDQSIGQINNYQILERLSKSRSKNISIYFIKCLRFSHDEGEFSFIPHLDNHQSKDLRGLQKRFSAGKELYQLQFIKSLSKKMQETSLNLDVRVLIANGDIQKYQGINYEYWFQRAKEYAKEVSSFLQDSQVTPTLETDVFDSTPTYQTMLKKVSDSLDKNNGQYMDQKEFLRILDNYHNCFKEILKGWSKESARKYTITSVARNISQGMFISEEMENPIFAVFNNPEVNGFRYNLHTRKKIPFIGYEKKYLEVLPNESL